MIQFDGLSIEKQLLVHIARYHVTRANVSQVTAFLAAGIDWEALIRNALTHKLLPALHTTFSELPKDLIPRELSEALAASYDNNRQRILTLCEEMNGLRAAAGALEIPTLSFKGAALAQTAYGEIAHRTAGDIDLLLHKDDITEFIALLKQRGYRDPYGPAQEFSPRKRQCYRRYQCQYLFVREADQLMVEPHWDFNPWTHAIDMDISSIWRRAIDIELCGATVKIPHAEDHLFIMCVHGAKDSWRTLRGICDVAALIQSHPELNIERILQRAQAQGCMRMLLLGIILAKEIIGAIEVEKFDAYISRDPALTELSRHVAENLFSDEPKEHNIWSVDSFRLQLRERPSDQVRSLWRTITTPRIQHLQIIDLPDKLYWLYYPIKLVYDYVALPCWKLVKRIRKIPPGSRSDPELEKARSRAAWRRKADAWGKWSTRQAGYGNELNRKLINLVRILPGDRVLDVAGGAGNPGIDIAEYVASTGSVISTDIVPEMLCHSRRQALEANIVNIRYCVADMNALPFVAESFDAVVSRFGLMFCQDHVHTLCAIRRLLKPGARAGFIVWGARDKNLIFDISSKVCSTFFGVEYTEKKVGPFALSEVGILECHLLNAGFSAVEEFEMRLDSKPEKESRFWQPVIEQSFDVDFDKLPAKVRLALDETLEEAFKPFLKGEQYHFTSSMRIGIGAA